MTDNGSPSGASTPLTLDLATEAPTFLAYLVERAEQELAAERGEAVKAEPVEVEMIPFSGGKYAYEKALRDASDLTHLEFRALIILSTYADEHLGDAFPGRERLAQHLGYSGSGAAREAGKVLGSLVSKGYARQVSRGSTGRASEYRLGLPTASA